LKRFHPLLPAVLAFAALPASGTDIVACVVAALPNNPVYNGAATTVTKLQCEFTNKDIYPTLPELYAQGWRLIQILGGDQALAKAGQGPSPLYLLERQATQQHPAPAGDAKKPEARKK
jgi:hypothetical protein